MPRKKSTKKTVARKSPRTHKRTAKTRVRRDPHAEYAEMMNKTGIATVSKLANDECVSNIPGRISTGSLAFDVVLENEGEPAEWHGIPLSRTIEIYGPPHIGKSTLLDQIFASVQRAGGIAVLADTETSRDRHYVERLGVDMDKLQYLEFESTSTTIENVLEAVSQSISFFKQKFPELPVVIGWDALAGTATTDEMEKGIVSEKAKQPGAAAKVMSSAARLVTSLLKGSRIAFVILNHEYDNINTGPFAGPKRTTFGGHGTRHMASLRVQLFNGKFHIKRSDGWVLGREVVAKVVKNRNGHHSLQAIIPMVIGYGSENHYTLYKTLSAAGVFEKKGHWSAVNIDGELISFQGWEGLRARCGEHPELYEKLVSVFWQLQSKPAEAQES